MFCKVSVYIPLFLTSNFKHIIHFLMNTHHKLHKQLLHWMVIKLLEKSSYVESEEFLIFLWFRKCYGCSASSWAVFVIFHLLISSLIILYPRALIFLARLPGMQTIKQSGQDIFWGNAENYSYWLKWMNPIPIITWRIRVIMIIHIRV